MSAVYLGQFEAGSTEWRAHRQGKIGGSDLAAILGLSKWQSAYALFRERRGEIEPQADKPQLEWGTRLEPIIVDAFTDRHPEFMVTYQPGQVWQHPDRPWQVVSPDALLGLSPTTLPARPVSGLEAKTARYDYDWADGPPDYYAVQAQWAMDVFSVPTWRFAVLFSGSDYREFEVEAQPAVQQGLRETASDFLDSIEQGKVPPIDGHDSTYNAVRELHPDLIDEKVDVGDVGRRWVQTKRDLAAAEDAEKEAKALLAVELGNSRRALVDGVQVAYRKNAGGGRPPVLTAANGLLKIA